RHEICWGSFLTPTYDWEGWGMSAKSTNRFCRLAVNGSMVNPNIAEDVMKFVGVRSSPQPTTVEAGKGGV
ncbi:MAG: hypothetical protein WCP20_24460, partial [Desulfuromonadales bacterium]